MVFMDNLYISQNIKNAAKVMRKLKRRKRMHSVHLICVNPNSNNYFEIFESGEAFKNIFASKNYIIAGLATDKPDALRMIVHILTANLNAVSSSENLHNKMLSNRKDENYYETI